MRRVLPLRACLSSCSALTICSIHSLASSKHPHRRGAPMTRLAAPLGIGCGNTQSLFLRDAAGVKPSSAATMESRDLLQVEVMFELVQQRVIQMAAAVQP